MSERVVSPFEAVGDGRDKALRPLAFRDFVGQADAIENLKIYWNE